MRLDDLRAYTEEAPPEALSGGRTGRWLRAGAAWLVAATFVLVLVLGLVVAAAYGTDFLLDGPQREVDRVVGPGGDRELRVQEGVDGIDSYWEVWVHGTDGGGRSAAWEAACLHGDDPGNAFDSVEWRGRDTLLIHVGDGDTVLTVPLDPATGRPLQRLVTGDC